MIKRLTDCISEYGSHYRLRELIRAGKLFKLEPGVYSDSPDHGPLEVLLAKYPRAVVTLDSAFHYYNLTDELPNQYHLATDRDDGKIKDSRVKQLFVPAGTCFIGVTEIDYCGEKIRIYDKERLLIETVRYKTKLPLDLYHEVIGNFRDVRHELYGAKIDDYLQSFPRRDVLFKIIRDEVF
jgi:hypothetical protein